MRKPATDSDFTRFKLKNFSQAKRQTISGDTYPKCLDGSVFGFYSIQRFFPSPILDFFSQEPKIRPEWKRQRQL
jgi:hypothetical protein